MTGQQQQQHFRRFGRRDKKRRKKKNAIWGSRIDAKAVLERTGGQACFSLTCLTWIDTTPLSCRMCEV